MSIRRSFAIAVENLESRRLLAAGFQIELVYEASVPASVQAVIQTAANRWQQIITGDIPDTVAGAWGSPVDDIRITARVKTIDGAGGGVAQARPTYIRNAGGSNLPIAGEIEIDSADIATQTAAGTLQNIVTHEISHALGYGTLWSQFPGLTTGLGGSDPQFLGYNALTEYRALTGNYAATGVPLENVGGTGTRDAHWRESVFGIELLTGYVNAGYSPISRVSIAQFADLGYQVNLNAADYFSIGTVTPPAPTGATISGNVFNDANRNGAKDANEGGLNGQTVYLDANYNGALDYNEKSTTSDYSGNYTFTGVPAGTYAIRLSGTTNQTSPASNQPWWLTVGNGQTASNYNFGVGGTVAPPTATGSLAGRVYNDANRNGSQDNGEAGLSGRTVYVDLNYNGTKDAGETSTTTDGSGNYTLSGLAASNAYAVRQVLASGETQTTPSGNNAWWVALGAGQAIANLNFGTAGTSAPPTGGGTLGGKVFVDANRNGSQDGGEAGQANATVYLDANYNGTLDAGERSITTNASGDWSFSSLSAGTYAVRVVATSTTQTYPFNNQSQWVQLNANASNTNLNFGLAGTGGGGGGGGITIGGTVYRDVNYNGTKESSEAGQAGRTVYVDANYNGQLDAGEVTTFTDASGVYRFTTLAAGTYAIRAVGLSGWYQTRPSSNGSWWLTVSAGATRTDLDFGFGF